MLLISDDDCVDTGFSYSLTETVFFFLSLSVI
jgi:hypothetical protein